MRIARVDAVIASPGPTPAALEVRYRVENPLQVPVLVQHLVETRPAFHPGAHVFHDGGMRVLLLCGTPPPPPELRLLWPGRPGAERLEPGEALEATIAQPLPLEEHTVGMPPDPDADAIHLPITRLRLVIEYQPEQRGVRVKTYPSGYVFDAWGPAPRRAEAEAMLPTTVTLRRRTADFPRPAL